MRKWLRESEKVKGGKVGRWEGFKVGSEQLAAVSGRHSRGQRGKVGKLESQNVASPKLDNGIVVTFAQGATFEL